MTGKVVVLTGGVGGAKLVEGLCSLVAPCDLTAIVNTGDDFIHLGLPVSPDIDTLLYTLSGKSNRTLGWGREGETWSFMDAARSLGAENWFNLGDGDLALHVLRRAALDRGETLSSIVQEFAQQWGLKLAILPMSDDAVATWVDTDIGDLPFQRYFVQHRCEPIVRAVRFAGSDAAAPAPGILEAIATADAIVFAPSNPWLSIDPILSVPGICEALRDAKAPVVAVSPLVGGKAVKGPTDKLIHELGLVLGNATIADHYSGLLDGLLVHEGDDAPASIVATHCDTLMKSAADKIRVARAALNLAGRCRS